MITDAIVQDVLRRGEILSCQLTRLGSNYTFVVNIALDGEEALGIYKPRDGEAPLWDFPNGTLYKRECAAYLLSEILGWGLVPFTPDPRGAVRHRLGPAVHRARPEGELLHPWRRLRRAIEGCLLL